MKRKESNLIGEQHYTTPDFAAEKIEFEQNILLVPLRALLMKTIFELQNRLIISVFIVTVTIYSVLLLAACSNQEVVDKEPIKTVPTRTLKLKASMPGEEINSGMASTRVSFTETEEGTITVQWKAGDKIHLCFVSEDGSIVRTVSDVAITNISANGKRGNFEVAIPEGITGTFHLYGVYGASFSPANSRTVLLPAPSASSSGTALNDTEAVSVMRFAAENLTESSSPQVSFSHIGSIFSVWIYNDTASPVSLGQITLSSAGKEYNWLRNSSGQATFDIAANSFLNANAGTELVYVPPAGTTIAAGGSLKLYRWVVPGNEIDPADTSKLMDIKDINGSTFTETISARALQTGKYYRLKMVYDGSGFRYIKIPTDSGLVGYWPFNGDAVDVAGGNNGTLFGDVILTTDRNGHADAAYQFSGNSSYIKCVSPGITGTGARTFSFWAKADALSASEQAILSYGGSISAHGGRFEISLATGEMICDISWSNLGMKSAVITPAVWNFYTVVFIGGANQTLSTGVRYYVNGNLITVVGRRSNYNDVINTLSNNPIYFGSLFGTERYFKGAIDEVRMYNRALIESEVKGLYYKDRPF